MEFITAIVSGLGTAMTTFVPNIATTLVDGFSGLFWVTAAEGAAGAGSLTLLGQGLLAIAGIGLTIGAILKVYHIFSGRVRKSM